MADSSDISNGQSREIGAWGAFSTVGGSLIGLGIFGLTYLLGWLRINGRDEPA